MIRPKLEYAAVVQDIGKYSFPHRMVEKWNALNKKLLQHNFKEKLDKWRQDTMSPTPTLYNTTR
ncbi:hypothetical protein E2C01_097437 [Portunus trituberculatus]|uniref:Uncharacterized protein n=1 Tax=Portunus trituberculatus TaxID=210409 RepID=A0A5B7K9X8_PORTR|nr:hypothetical protein [Portunus trituberculatus]